MWKNSYFFILMKWRLWTRKVKIEGFVEDFVFTLFSPSNLLDPVRLAVLVWEANPLVFTCFSSTPWMKCKREEKKPSSAKGTHKKYTQCSKTEILKWWSPQLIHFSGISSSDCRHYVAELYWNQMTKKELTSILLTGIQDDESNTIAFMSLNESVNKYCQNKLGGILLQGNRERATL